MTSDKPETPQTSNEITSDPGLTESMRQCLTQKGVRIQKLDVNETELELIVCPKPNLSSCQIVDAIRECSLQIGIPFYSVSAYCIKKYEDAGSDSASSQPTSEDCDSDSTSTNAVADASVTDTDPPMFRASVVTDTDPPLCVAVSPKVEDGTLSVNEGRVENLVEAAAKKYGVEVDDLKIKTERGKKDRLLLKVSGKIRSPRLSEERSKRVITALMSRFTGIVRIDSKDLEVKRKS